MFFFLVWYIQVNLIQVNTFKTGCSNDIKILKINSIKSRKIKLYFELDCQNCFIAFKMLEKKSKLFFLIKLTVSNFRVLKIDFIIQVVPYQLTKTNSILKLFSSKFDLTRVNLEQVSSASWMRLALSMYFAHLELINRSAVSNDWASSMQRYASIAFPACWIRNSGQIRKPHHIHIIHLD